MSRQNAATVDILKVEAQQALDELLSQDAIPFKLIAYKVNEEDFADSYVVSFYDSRFPLVVVNVDPGQSFKDLVRAAVLTGTEKMNGPLGTKRALSVSEK